MKITRVNNHSKCKQNTITTTSTMSSITNAIYSREEFINELNWTDEISEYFIQHTTRESLKGKYKHGRCITDFLFTQYEVHLHFGMFFWFRHFQKKLAELKNNYTLFTWIIDQPAIVYDAKYKRVYASEEQWLQFKKVHEFHSKVSKGSLGFNINTHIFSIGLSHGP